MAKKNISAALLTGGFDFQKHFKASKQWNYQRLGISIRWEDVAKYPLNEEEIFCLHYMMDIETHTAVYQRDLLNTSAIRVPEFTAFLMKWAAEEYWHGELFSDFLRNYRVAEDPIEAKLEDGSTAMPTRSNRTALIRAKVKLKETNTIILSRIASALFKDFPAIHMTWGAINELTTLTGYQQMVHKTKHPLLKEILKCIIKEEREHFAFYRAAATALLYNNKKGQRLVRNVIKRIWTPVGVGLKPMNDFLRLVRYLLGPDGEKVALDMDNNIASIPGMERMKLIETVWGKAYENHKIYSY